MGFEEGLQLCRRIEKLAVGIFVKDVLELHVLADSLLHVGDHGGLSDVDESLQMFTFFAETVQGFRQNILVL